MDFYKKRTLTYKGVKIVDGYTVAGPKENAGKLSGRFDIALKDDRFGQDTFEHAERKMFEHALDGVIAKANLIENEVDAILGGDLLNQLISTSFSAKKQHAGFLGLYNACATFAESLIVGAAMLNNGLDNVVAIAGSHFSTAERQYRYPLELGVLRSPVTQWTATGVGATLLSRESQRECPEIVHATIGRVVDYGITDINNMGACMAPAAKDTLITFFNDTDTKPDDYDLILTGDLGKLGSELLVDMMRREGYDISKNIADCGVSLYFDEQQTFQGGSGVACSPLVFNSIIINKLNLGELNRIVLVGTGALMSTTTTFQGDSMPAIAHLVEVVSSDYAKNMPQQN